MLPPRDSSRFCRRPSRAAWPVPALVLALALVACRDDGGDPEGSPLGVPDPTMAYGPPTTGTSPFHRDGGFRGAPDADLVPPDASPAGVDALPADPSTFNCPDVPTAYVFDHADPYTKAQGGAADLLTKAGFSVVPLPLDRDPKDLRGLIFFASFASESPAYRAYVSRNALSLTNFIDQANVIVQMTQADQTEAIAPFLPPTLKAHRSDLDVAKLFAVSTQDPLMNGVPLDADRGLSWNWMQVGWETYDVQKGFEVMLAANGNAQFAALLEAEYGEGRLVLTSMASDKPVGLGPARDQFNKAFFANLFQHTRDVCRRQAPPINVTPSSGPTFTQNSTMLAVLPDTQIYSLFYPGVFISQTAWIASNAQSRRIPYVFHLGDIVDGNTAPEWDHASQAMWLLEGIVPYALVTGNHDYGPAGNAATRDTLLNDYFSYQRTAAWPTFGGAFEVGKLDNTYHLFSVGGRDYIVMALEWGPRDQVVAWADQVMTEHPDRYGILITHAYLNNDDRRYDIKDKAHPQDFDPHFYPTPGPVNDGEELWQKLVRKHPFLMVFNGHVLGDGTGYLASVTDKGTTCHQMLSNYQFRDLGGEGYMRLVEFLEDGKTVRVYTYSPLYDDFLVAPDQSYSFTIDEPLGKPPG